MHCSCINVGVGRRGVSFVVIPRVLKVTLGDVASTCMGEGVSIRSYQKGRRGISCKVGRLLGYDDTITPPGGVSGLFQVSTSRVSRCISFRLGWKASDRKKHDDYYYLYACVVRTDYPLLESNNTMINISVSRETTLPTPTVFNRSHATQNATNNNQVNMLLQTPVMQKCDRWFPQNPHKSPT